jgi:hypothetical protein
VANAYFFTHTLKRENRVGVFERMPVPPAEPVAIQRIVRSAHNYLEAAGAGASDLFHDGFSESQQRERLLRLDAEVLRLYDLPARAERKLLDLFTGEDRPGVPVAFSRYYPEGFTGSVPLYAYLSDSFQRKLNGGDPALPAAIESRYEELMERQEAGTLTSDEQDELYDLQAEVDGLDYALQVPDDSWLAEADQHQRVAEAALGKASQRAIDALHRGGSHHED